MLDSDHNRSTLTHANSGQLPPLAWSCRHRRLRMLSRESTRARVRVGLIVAVASVLLMVIAARWYVEARHIDLATVLKQSIFVVASITALYCLGLLGLAAVVRRRRSTTPEAADDHVGRAA